MQDVTDSVFYTEFGHIMWSAPVVGLEFTRYLPIVIVPYALLQARFSYIICNYNRHVPARRNHLYSPHSPCT